MKNLPKLIYLQIGEITPEEFETEELDFNELSQVTWCKDNINDSDIEYCLKEDLLESLEIHVMNNEDDWNRNPQAAMKDFIKLLN